MIQKPSVSLKMGEGNREISALISSLLKNFCLDIKCVHKMFLHTGVWLSKDSVITIKEEISIYHWLKVALLST